MNNSLEYLRDPSRWQMNRVCPLKKSQNGQLSCAVVVFLNNNEYKIIEKNLYMIAQADLIEGKITTPEKIIEDGWMVD